MSCITELLKLKGNKEVLLPSDENGKPWVAVEGGGTYKGLEYLIVMNLWGHRCGYVALPSNHVYNKDLDYNKLDIHCHGGLTFSGSDHGLKDLLTMPCKDNWIGFDCGHCYDYPDTESFIKYFGEEAFQVRKTFFDTMQSLNVKSDIRKYPYVEEECHSIIDQLLLVA